jgi:hypothetical protein
MGRSHQMAADLRRALGKPAKHAEKFRMFNPRWPVLLNEIVALEAEYEDRNPEPSKPTSKVPARVETVPLTGKAPLPVGTPPQRATGALAAELAAKDPDFEAFEQDRARRWNQAAQRYE